MQRRQILRGLAGAGALAVAGCVADGSPDDAGAGGGTDAPTDTPTDTDSPNTMSEDDSPADTPIDSTDDETDSETPPDGSDAPSDSSDETTSDVPTRRHVDTAHGTPPGGSEPSATPGYVTDRSLDVLDSACGSRVDDASVSFDDGVTVTGTIWGNDACHTATLEDVDYAADSLTVVVAAEDDSGADEMCGQCITEIEYEASAAVDDGGPDEVVVVHVRGDERTTVATARR